MTQTLPKDNYYLPEDMSVDLPLLKAQRGTLLKLVELEEVIGDEEKNHLDGLINLIDAIADRLEGY